MSVRKSVRKIESGMVTLVVVDNPDVQKSLSRILSEVDPTYRVYCSRNAWSFQGGSLGVDSDFSLDIRYRDDGLAKVASVAKEVYLAQLPDDRGDYDAYRVSLFLRKLKLSVPMYRLRLSTVSVDSVTYSFMHPVKYSANSHSVASYEARLALDRLVYMRLSELFRAVLPFSPELETFSGSVLQEIAKCTSMASASVGSVPVSYPVHLADGEVSPDELGVLSEMLSSGVSLDDYMLHYGIHSPWIGSVKALGEAYAAGLVSWPTDPSSRTMYYRDTDDDRFSDIERWGIYATGASEGRIVSEGAEKASSEAKYLRNLVRTDVQVRGVTVASAFSEQSVPPVVVDGIVEETCGCTQSVLARLFLRVGLPSKLWAYQLLSLVKSGLVVQLDDTTFGLTSNGRLVLEMLRRYVPVLLDEDYLSSVSAAVSERYDSDVDRYDALRSLWDSFAACVAELSQDGECMELPESAASCPSCGGPAELHVTGAGTFLSCVRRSCDAFGAMEPVTYDNYVAYIAK